MPWKDKEKKNAHARTYYCENKDRINAVRNTKFECACGGKFTKRNQVAHTQPKNHQKWLETNELSEKMDKTTNTEDTIK